MAVWHRVVFKEKVNNENLYHPFEMGEQIINDNEYQYLRREYPDSIVEIQMSDDEWLRYGAEIAVESYNKAMKLDKISASMGLDVSLPVAFEPRTVSLNIHHLSSSEDTDRKLDPNGYGGGFNDVINKACSYKVDVDAYEKAVFDKIILNTRQR